MRRLIETAVHEAVQETMPRVLAQMAADDRKLTGPLNPVQFTWQIAFAFIRNGMPVVAAKKLAIETLAEFLGDEGIRFRARGYLWDQPAAKTLAEEYEIRHWESSK